MRIASQDEIKSFHEHGFIIIKNAVPSNLLISFKNTLASLLDIFMNRHASHFDQALDCDEKIIALKNKNPHYISLIQKIVSRTPEFFSLSSCTYAAPFMRSLHHLDQPSPVYIINNGVVFTCPNDSNNTAVSNFETDWHNDVFYTIPYSKFWQVWVPLLHDATQEIGTIIICSGSHKDGIGKQHINIETSFNHRYTIEQEVASMYSQKSIDVALGDMLIFDSKLIHKSGTNHSAHVRCSMLGSYHDASYNHFLPVSFEYRYHRKTPEGYFYDIFGDENAKKIMLDDIADEDLSLKTGV